jgi:hypothetical protein
MVKCKILFSESSNYLGQIVKFLGNEYSLECTSKSHKNKSDLEN